MRFRLKAGTGITGARIPLEDREPGTLDGHCLQDSPIPFIVQIQFLRTHPPSKTQPYPKIRYDLYSPCQGRTGVFAVKGQWLSRLPNGPYEDTPQLFRFMWSLLSVSSDESIDHDGTP